jgi:nicotinamide phosphoribosyltransferase
MKFIKTPFEIADAYKLSHWIQYPAGTTGIYSNFTPRKSRRPGVDKFVYFGLQYFLMEMNYQFNENFFNLSEDKAVENFDNFYTKFFGVKNEDSNEKVRALHRLGYLPIKIKALPEGSVVEHNIPTATFQTTHEDFFWFTQFIETWHSCMIWKPSTSATTAYYYRKTFEKYNKLTSDIDWIVDFQGHDFSFRGQAGVEDACASGAAHLISFKGTDTCPSISWIEYYYPGVSGLLGTSVPATEHSVQTAFLNEITNDTEQSDLDYTLHTLEMYPSGIVSQVSDGYDFWKFVTNVLPKVKDKIMARDGKFVIRPDSSIKTPVEIIIGDSEAPVGTPEYKGLIECLYEIFGGTKNSKGYIDLDPHIGAIYGDSITLEYQEKILDGLMRKGFSSNNIVLGIGSYTYQYVTRDTHGIAIKATAVSSGTGLNRHWRSTYKDPKTDNSGKKSAKGLLKVDFKNGKYILLEEVTEDQEKEGCLETVYEDGKIVRIQSFDNIRNTLAKF